MSIYLVTLLNVLNSIALRGSRVLMSLFAIQLGAGAFEIGLLIAVSLVFQLFLGIYAGRVADRYGFRLPILLGSLGSSLAMLVPWLLPDLTGLYGSRALTGLSFIFFAVAIQNLAASMDGPDMRARNLSTFTLGGSISGMIAPLLVGFSIDHRGHVATFLYLTLIVAASCVAWVACRRKIPHSGTAPKSAPTGGVRELLRQPRLRRIMIMSGLVVAGVDLYTFYMPIYGHSIDLSATMIGVILGAHAAANLVVRSFLPQLVRRWGEERVMTTSMVLAGVTFLLFPFAGQVAFLLLLSFTLGLVLGVGQPLSLVMTYNRAPAGRTGEALGMRFTVVNVTHMVIPMAAGTIGAALGVVTVFYANAALLLGGGYAHYRSEKKA